MKYNMDRAWASLEKHRSRYVEAVKEVPVKFVDQEMVNPGAITNVVFGNWTNCLYCGASPDCRDHVVPTSMFYSEGIISKGSNPGPRVIACTDCNSRINAKYIPSLTGRCLKIQELIRNRFHKLLRCPTWEQEELDEYDYTLKCHIIHRTQMREIIEKRLEWQNSKLYLVMRRQIREFVKERYPNNKWLRDFVKIRKSQMRNAGNFLV